LSYRLDICAPLGGQIQAVGDYQLAIASKALAGGTGDPHEAIRQARKRLKKVRGLYVLIRSGVPDFHAAEYGRLRRLAQQLGDVRDASALVDACDRLVDENDDPAARRTLIAIRDRLEERCARIAREDDGLYARIEETLGGCESAQSALHGLALRHSTKKQEKIIRRGVLRVYTKLCKRYALAQETGAVEDFHALRKWMKYHWMHLRLLRDVWPGEMAIRAEKAKAVANVLGLDHDAALLGEMAIRLPEVIGTRAEIETLIMAVETHGARLHGAIDRPLAQLCAVEPDHLDAIMKRLLIQARKRVSSR